jgi:hypothetical protein
MTLTPHLNELPCDPVVQQARQERLDRLYVLDGRDHIDHENRGLYTGLALKYPDVA